MRASTAIVLRSEHGFSSFPVLAEGKLVGIVTGRDIRAAESDAARLETVMTTELITVSAGATPESARELMYKHRKETMPVVESDGTLSGTGRIGGRVLTFPNSVVTAGETNRTGTLTIDSELDLNGTYHCKLAGATADHLVIGESIFRRVIVRFMKERDQADCKRKLIRVNKTITTFFVKSLLKVARYFCF